MTQLSTIPLRLTIGITGHRPLEDEARIREVVRSLVDRIKSTVTGSETTPVELCVLSPLAEGTDRVVAEEILSHDPHAVLDVMLPLAEEDYIEDFNTKTSRKQFQRLLGMARKSAALQKLPLREAYPEDMLAKARCQAYEDVGHFVVDHCDLLVAVWNGKEAKGVGGTGDIVDYANQQSIKRPVYVIDANNPKLNPIPDLYSEALWAKIDTWNRHNEHHIAQKDNEKVFHSLLPKNDEPEIPLDDRKIYTLKNKLIPHYLKADNLAMLHQSRYMLMGNMIFWLAFVAVSGVAIAEIFLREHEALFLSAFGLELCFMLGIIGIVLYDKYIGHFHKNWIECRYLAERIRSAFFYCICGMEGYPTFVC